MAHFSFRLTAMRLNDRHALATQRWRAAAALSSPGAARAGRRTVHGDALASADLLDADDALESSSWFESTWDLQQGLDIAEGLPTDLPLELWLQVSLASCGAEPGEPS